MIDIRDNKFMCEWRGPEEPREAKVRDIWDDGSVLRELQPDGSWEVVGLLFQTVKPD